jgi:hypothetical protein
MHPAKLLVGGGRGHESLEAGAGGLHGGPSRTEALRTLGVRCWGNVPIEAWIVSGKRARQRGAWLGRCRGLGS